MILMRRCGPGFATTPRITRGVGFGPLTMTPGLRAGSSITRRSTAFGARKGYGYRSVEATTAPN